MSLITACPACQTQFEVTDEQLLAYAGKVRCGECNHVFDARSSLFEAESAVEEALQTDEGTERVPSSAVIEKTASAPIAVIQEEPAQPVAELDSRIEPVETNTASLDAEIAETEAAEPAPVLSWNISPKDTYRADIPEFLRNVPLIDERPLPPESPARPWVFSVLSVILLVGVLAQWVYFSRTNLAANYPQTKPLLQSLCRVAHCEVALPHEIAQLTIDDADIQEHRERENVLVFSSVLINHGSVPQAYPMIELTLTNMADEPVLRKILKPGEYLPTTSKADQGLAAQQEQPVKTALGVEDKAVTGFRVAIAY